MKISATSKLITEDYPDTARTVVTKLAQTLNPFLDQINTALGSNVTLTDNLKAQAFSQYLMAGISTCKLTWTLNERPTDVRIAQISRRDGSTPSAVFCLHWSFANNVINCTFLGLDAGKAHDLVIVGQV